MKKYTIKEFAEGKKAVKIENEEQWNKLNKVHGLCRYHGSSYYTNKESYTSGENYLKLNSWEVLEFSQLDFEDEFVVGKWCLKLETQEINEAVNSIDLWRGDELTWYDNENYKERWIGYDGKYMRENEIEGYTEITFEEFKTHILKESTMQEIKVGSQFKVPGESANTIYTFNRIEGDGVDVTWGTTHHVHYYLSTCLANIKDGSWILINKESTMEKEILEYKLVKPEYEKATIKLLGWNFTTKLLINISEKGDIHRLKEAGVLDLWFEKVYAPDKPKLPSINGKQCVDNGNKTITCGCTTKSFDWVLGVEYAMGDDIYISNTRVTQKEIRQIVEYIKNNK